MGFLVLLLAIVILALLMKATDSTTIKKSEHCKGPHQWNYHYTNEEEYIGMFCSECGFKAGSE